MDAYPQVQQEPTHDPSQIGHYPSQEGYASQPGSYPVTAAPPAFNTSAPNTAQHQGQTYQPGNHPIMSPPPSYSPPAPTNVVNNQTTVVTQVPAIVSISYFCLITILNDSHFLFFQKKFCLAFIDYICNILN